jgi:hypothetical protein
VLEVDPGVEGLGQVHHAAARALIDPSGRGPTAIAMDEGGGTTSSIGRPQALDLPDGAVQEPGGFGDEQFAAFQGVENDQLLLCSLRQGHHTSVFGVEGVTFSLNA